MKLFIEKAFDLGRIVITPDAKRTLWEKDVNLAIGRHAICDWGDVSEDDWLRNNKALKDGTRLFSAYVDSNNERFWIITEADRSYTTVLLPEDY